MRRTPALFSRGRRAHYLQSSGLKENYSLFERYLSAMQHGGAIRSGGGTSAFLEFRWTLRHGVGASRFS
jgi:hypothetical protein